MTQAPTDPAAPLCSCERPALKRSVLKNGANYGKDFWTCANGSTDNGGCGFFQWCSGHSSAKKPPPPPPKRQIPRVQATDDIEEPEEPQPTRRKTFDADAVPFVQAMAKGAASMLTALSEFQTVTKDLAKLLADIKAASAILQDKTSQ